ncbi:MAG: putative baseplate assembly protein [Dehalococcoidia bacterium]|nr:putative baseplate assembly protein [Dehalococcoidia bacterium]
MSACPDNCTCCNGVTQRTPQPIVNTPGLSKIRYRSGRHPDFLASMQARLSSDRYPALRGLRTRDPRDFSMALLDAFAACADVLTFYQERIVAESYLRTATERRSLVHLGRLLGYQPNPGVAAETYLAFSLQEGPGAPDEVFLEHGMKVQSVPGPGEEPQVFETVDDLDARAEWTSLRAETSTPHLPVTTDCYLEGVGLNLRPGDALLFVGHEVQANVTRDNWDLRFITSVTTDTDRDLTHVTWQPTLGSVMPWMLPAAFPEVHVFRTRSAVFGHNAPLWRAMPSDYRRDYGAASASDWPNFTISPQNNAVDFESVQQGVTPGSWLVLVKPEYSELFKVTGTIETSRAEFAISGKVTRASLNGENYDLFQNEVRDTTVLAANEQLRFARRPVIAPVFGDTLALGSEVDGLALGQPLALIGPRAHLRVTEAGQTLEIVVEGSSRRLRRDEVLEVLAPPRRVVSGDAIPATPAQAQTTTVRWDVRDDQGRTGTVLARLGQLALSPPPRDAEVVSEVVQISSITGSIEVGDGRTALDLDGSIEHCYDPGQLVINANVARATHGETVTQVLGSGDAAKKNQRFSLLRLPLTFVGDDTARGVTSTVHVRVNDSTWQERPTLVDAAPGDHVYTLRTDGETTAVVQFGDGVRGTRPPTGRENILATYRRGIGSGGNLKAGQLSQLMSRPLGLAGVTNPAPARGGVDPDGTEDVREQIPLDVRTLGRAVSLRDYEDFSRAFAGIAKAHAAVLNLRAGRTIFITVAGDAGAVIAPDDPVLTRLVASLRASGDPHVRFEVASYVPASFQVRLRIKRRPDTSRSEVFERVEADLHRVFGFEERAFAQGVALSEVIAVTDGIEGVEAVDVEHFYRNATPTLATRLTAAGPRADAAGRAVAAELLTLADGPLAWLGEMP